MKKIIWMLSLALFSQVFLQAVTDKALDQDQAALKIQRAWLKSKGLLKPFFLKDSQNQTLEVFSSYKIKRLSSFLYNQIKLNDKFQDTNSLVVELPKEAVTNLIAYMNSYGSSNQINVENSILECPYVLDILYFSHQYQLIDLENTILQNIAFLASKHNLYAELSCKNLDQIVNRLSLNPDVVRKALESNKKYYPEILKASVKEIITHDNIWDIIFSNDNKYLAFCLKDGKVNLYDLETKQLDTVITNNKSVYKIVFSSDNRYLASCSNDTVKLYDLENKQLIDSVITPGSQYTHIAFSNDSKYLALESDSETVKLYDLENKRIINTSNINNTATVCHIAFSNDSKYLVIGSFSGEVRLYDLEGNLIDTVVNHQWSTACDTVLSIDNRYLASHLLGNLVKLYDLENKQLIDTVINHDDFVTNIAFSNDSKYLASCSRDNTVKLYDLENKLIDTVITHNGWVYNIEFSNDNKYLASCSKDGKVKLYDLENKQLIGTVITHDKSVRNVAFSKNNKYLAYSENHKYLALCLGDGILKLAGDTSHMSNKEIFDIVDKVEKPIKNNYCNIL